MCASIWNASSHAEEFAFDFGEFADTFEKVNKESEQESALRQVTVDFEDALTKLHDPIKKTNDESNISDSYKYDMLASQGIVVW